MNHQIMYNLIILLLLSFLLSKPLTKNDLENFEVETFDYELDENYDEALAFYLRINEEYPNEIRILNKIAYFHLKLNSLVENLDDVYNAEAYLLEALKIDANDSSINYNLACVYSLLNDIEKSFYYLEKSSKKSPPFAAIYDLDLSNVRELPKFNLLMKSYFTDKELSAFQNYKKGLDYEGQEDNKNAIKFHKKAIKLLKKSNYHSMLAEIHEGLALIYFDLGKNSKYFKEMKKVMKYFEKNGDKEELARCYDHLGYWHYSLNKDYKKSVPNYHRALELYKELQDSVKIAETLSTFSLTTNIKGMDVYKDGKEYDKYIIESIDYSQVALEIYVLINDTLHVAEEAERIGRNYAYMLNDYIKGIEYWVTAYELYEMLGLEENALEVKSDLANALLNQGKKYSAENRPLDCVEYLEYSLELNQNLQDLETRGEILLYLSMCYINSGELDKGLSLEKEIADIAQNTNNPELIIMSTMMKAIPLAAIGRGEDAIKLVDDTITYMRSLPVKEEELEDYNMAMYTFNAIAAFIASSSTKDLHVALPYIGECFNIAENFNLEDALYYYLKSLYYMYEEPDLAKSLKYMEKSVKDPSLKSNWIGLHNLITNELGIMYFYNGMFDKARKVLMDTYSLSKNNQDIKGVEKSLLYLSVLNFLEMAKYNFSNKELNKHSEQILSELITLLDSNVQLENKYAKEFFDINLPYYEWYAMILGINGKGLQSLDVLENIKSRVLKSKLQAIGGTNETKKSYVSNKSLSIFDNKSAVSILDTDIIINLDIINNKSHSAYQHNISSQTKLDITEKSGIDFSGTDDGFDLLVRSAYTSSDSIFWNFEQKNHEIFSESMPSLDVIVKIYRMYLLNSDPRSKELGQLLYKYLFTSDVFINRIKNKKHLIIMPDPILSYLPFETLIDEEGKYLIETYDISYIQSFDILSILQSRNYDADSNMLFAYGGIEYSEPDNSTLNENISMLELEEISASKIETRGSLTDIYSHMGYTEIPYLPFALSEVQEIGKYFPIADIVTGKDASENKLKEMSKSGKLAEYNVLHFSTHGFIVPDIPDLSALVLAADDNDQEDGYLNAYEIMNLDIKADFVNLSACETGLGKIYKGEGVVGLTQAFMIAGANSVSVTLWPVADKSTSIFMTEMYKIAEELDMSYLESMSTVKRKFINGDFGDEYRDPYYWAPFVYYGE